MASSDSSISAAFLSIGQVAGSMLSPLHAPRHCRLTGALICSLTNSPEARCVSSEPGSQVTGSGLGGGSDAGAAVPEAAWSPPWRLLDPPLRAEQQGFLRRSDHDGERWMGGGGSLRWPPSCLVTQSRAVTPSLCHGLSVTQSRSCRVTPRKGRGGLSWRLCLSHGWDPILQARSQGHREVRSFPSGGPAGQWQRQDSHPAPTPTSRSPCRPPPSSWTADPPGRFCSSLPPATSRLAETRQPSL